VGLNSFHLFAGAGGGILGDLLLGHRTIGAVEIESYPRKVLLARQLDGSLPRFPIWDDVKTFRADNPDTAGYIERLREGRENLVICGGFPCQDISSAGRGAGITGERSGLWTEMARIISEVQPKYAFVENSPMLTSRGLGVVLGDLAAMGYDARWGVFSAAEVGAPHIRERIFILANSKKDNARQPFEQSRDKRKWENCQEVQGRFWHQSSGLCEDVPNPAIINAGGLPIGTEPAFSTSSSVCENGNATIKGFQDGAEIEMGEPGPFEKLERSNWWTVEPNVGRVANGVASRVDRLKAIGNGQVPQVVKLAWETLIGS